MKQQKMSVEDLKKLADELVVEKPNLGKVASLASKLNFSYQGDIVDLMTNVLSEMNRLNTNSKNKSNQIEVL